MTADKSRNKVQTVLGKIDPDMLGITLPHEHILIDMSIWYEEPGDDKHKPLARQKVSLQNLSWVKWNVYNNLDNVILEDEQTAIDELLRYKSSGGKTVVDVTSNGLGRDPEKLVNGAIFEADYDDTIATGFRSPTLNGIDGYIAGFAVTGVSMVISSV